MKIVIDTRWIFPTFSGIGFYTQELIRSMIPMAPEHDFILLFNHAEVEARVRALPEFKGLKNLEVQPVDYGPFALKSQIALPRLLRSLEADLFFSPNWMVPYLSFPRSEAGIIKLAVTLHDLIPLILRDHAPQSKKSKLFPVFRSLMHETAKRADLILTPSESSRNDVIKHLHIPEANHKKVLSTPEAAAKHYVPTERPKTEPPEFLYVGRFDPYKNVPFLIRSFAKVAAKHPFVRLRFIGEPDPRYPDAQQEVDRLNLKDRIIWQGYTDSDGLLKAYQNATALVFPSRYEGFGLPVLEAMASGTPVICSNTSSLPEVAGDAAMIISPDDEEKFAETMLCLLNEAYLQRTYRAKGLLRAEEFSWDKTARQTLDAFEALFTEGSDES